MTDEQQNLVLDGLRFSFLLRFCQAERVIVGRSRIHLTEFDNADLLEPAG